MGKPKRPRRSRNRRPKLPAAPLPPPPARPLILEIVERLILERQRLYEEQGDPYRAWEVLAAARAYREWGIVVPGWVLEYLDRVASRLVEISRLAPSGDALASHVLSALEMTSPGRGTVFSRRKAADEADELARDTAQLIAGGTKAYVAYEDIGKAYQRGKSTVERAYTEAQARKRLISRPDTLALKRADFPNGVPDGSTVSITGAKYVVTETVQSDQDVVIVRVRPS
jgi:hypothetical protein